MDHCIKPEGWDTKWKVENCKSIVSFYEYQCTGPGSINTPQRVKSGRPQLKDVDIKQLLSPSFVDPDAKNSWLEKINQTIENILVIA